MEIKIELPTNAIKTILLFAAKKDRRDYLNGLLLEVSKKGIFLAATDGAHLGAYRVPDTSANRDALPARIESRWPLPASLLTAPICLDVKKYPLTTVILDDSATEFSAECCGAIVRGATKFYPDWRRVVPRTVTGEPGQYAPELMGNFQKAAKLLGRRSHPYPVIGYNGKEGSALVSIGMDEFIGVISPFRFDGDFPSSPEWSL